MLDEPVPISWPRQGDISFENVSLRYEGQRDEVIKNLRLKIPYGQRVSEFQIFLVKTWLWHEWLLIDYSFVIIYLYIVYVTYIYINRKLKADSNTKIKKIRQ